MKRLVMIATLLMLLGMTSRGILAQDTTPAADASPSSALLNALGYPTLSIAYDGSAVTIADKLDAGRYLVDFTNTSGSTPDILTFLGATADHPMDEIMTALQSVDPSQGPPPIYYQIKVAGISDDAPKSVVTLTPGDWALLVVGKNGPVVAQLTVSGEMPAYDDVSDAVQVDLHEMTIDMPDTVAAGDHLWQIENTGAFPHMLSIVRVADSITDAQVINAIKLEVGAPDATPVATGQSGDPGGLVPVINSGVFSNGLTQILETNLEAGTYVAFCFASGPGDVGLHAMAGMYKIFTVK